MFSCRRPLTPPPETVPAGHAADDRTAEADLIRPALRTYAARRRELCSDGRIDLVTEALTLAGG
jgi:hypothetical protein